MSGEKCCTDLTRSCQPYRDQKREHSREREHPLPTPKGRNELSISRNRNEAGEAGGLRGRGGWYDVNLELSEPALIKVHE